MRSQKRVPADKPHQHLAQTVMPAFQQPQLGSYKMRTYFLIHDLKLWAAFHTEGKYFGNKVNYS